MNAPQNHRNDLLHSSLLGFLRKYQFNMFITLATNWNAPNRYDAPPLHNMTGDQILTLMQDKLQSFTNRVNRKIAGPRWHKHPDEIMLGFAFIEKLSSNPHWHIVAMVEPEQLPVAEAHSKKIWDALCPGGSLDHQLPWEKEGLEKYVSKEIKSDPKAFQRFEILGRIN